MQTLVDGLKGALLQWRAEYVAETPKHGGR